MDIVAYEVLKKAAKVSTLNGLFGRYEEFVWPYLKKKYPAKLIYSFEEWAVLDYLKQQGFDIRLHTAMLPTFWDKKE